jgi:hypothetical protein
LFGSISDISDNFIGANELLLREIFPELFFPSLVLSPSKLLDIDFTFKNKLESDVEFSQSFSESSIQSLRNVTLSAIRKLKKSLSLLENSDNIPSTVYHPKSSLEYLTSACSMNSELPENIQSSFVSRDSDKTNSLFLLEKLLLKTSYDDFINCIHEEVSS